jgi:hypothetical protein
METDEVTPLFNEREQVEVDRIIQERLERQKRKDNERHQAEVEEIKKAAENRIKAEFAAEEAQRFLNRPSPEELATLEQAKTEAAEAEAKASQLEAEQQRLQSETAQLRKEHAMNSALHDMGFIDPQMIKTLTSSKFEWSDEHGQYIVRDVSGHVRMAKDVEYVETNDPGRRFVKSITEAPMTIAEYYAEYGAARPYLVKGETKGGSGSVETPRRTGYPMHKSHFSLKQKVKYIESHGLSDWSKLPS